MSEQITGYTDNLAAAEIAAQRIVIAALSSGSIKIKTEVAGTTSAADVGRYLGHITATLAQTLHSSKKA